MADDMKENVAEMVAYLESVKVELGYDVAAILRKSAANLRTFKAGAKHDRADLLDQAALDYESRMAAEITDGSPCAVIGCAGAYQVAESKDCSCHISPPCGPCVSAGLACDTCGDTAE